MYWIVRLHANWMKFAIKYRSKKQPTIFPTAATVPPCVHVHPTIFLNIDLHLVCHRGQSTTTANYKYPAVALKVTLISPQSRPNIEMLNAPRTPPIIYYRHAPVRWVFSLAKRTRRIKKADWRQDGFCNKNISNCESMYLILLLNVFCTLRCPLKEIDEHFVRLWINYTDRELKYVSETSKHKSVTRIGDSVSAPLELDAIN